MEISKSKKSFLLVVAFFAVAITSFFIGQNFSSDNFFEDKNGFLSSIINGTNSESPKPLENPPEVIKAVYITGWSAGSKNYRQYLDHVFETTSINAVVVDIKEVTGFTYYKTESAKSYQRAIPDIDELVNYLHKKGIYIIARMAVFKDYTLAKARPDLAIYDKSKTEDPSNPVLWEDYRGLYWVDPSSKEVQDYNIEIAKESASHGFDEINFDYIRFPSDGNLKNMGFPAWDQKTPRNLVIKDFAKKIREEMPNTKISIDLFGLTTVNNDDLGIGQVLEDLFEYFDYIYPMVYPSHYANGFLGYSNPADYPYEVVKYSLDKALLRRASYIESNPDNPSQPVPPRRDGMGARNVARIRPWLQDFDLGAYYDTDKVLKEIKATKDSAQNDFNGFLLWNPSNFYTLEAIISDDSDL